MADDVIRFTVPGAIVPWQRARRRQFANGTHVTFTSREVEAYHSTVRMAAAQAMAGRPPLECAVGMSVRAVFAVPASWSRKRRALALSEDLHKVTKPDIENMAKGAMDALQSVVYVDDRQIVGLTACKVYGETPRLEIAIFPLS